MPDDDAIAQHRAILDALSDVDGHMHKRVELMTRALIPATSGEFAVFDQPALEYSEEKASGLFNLAWDGNEDAVAALSLIASRLLWQGKQLPPKLAATISHVLMERGQFRPKRKRGRYSEYDYVTRGIAIIRRIQAVCDERGLYPTRSPGEKGDDDMTAGKACGCSVVADEMGMDERAVEEIWGTRKRYGIP